MGPPTPGSNNLECLWQGRGRPLHLRRQLSLPNILWPTNGPTFPFMLFPSCGPPSSHQQDQRELHSPSGGPPLADPVLVPRDDSAASSSTMANTLEERPPFLGEQDDLAPPARAVGPPKECPKYYI